MRAHLKLTPRLSEIEGHIDRVVEVLPPAFVHQHTRMALGEALSNAVLHGALCVTRATEREPEQLARLVAEAERWCPEERVIEVEVEASATEAKVKVRDPGKGFDWRRVAGQVELPAASSTGGRGMFIMRHCAQRLSYNAPGNELVLTFCVVAPGAEDGRATGEGSRSTRATVPGPSCAQATRPVAQVVRERVLVVDDLEVNRRLVASILERAGYEVIEAESGESALVAMPAEAPDVVVLDLNMPGMSGLAVLGKMRERGLIERFPTVMLTATNASAAVKDEAFERGIWQFLSKPVRSRELLTQVKSVLSRSRALKVAARERDEQRSWLSLTRALVDGLMPQPETTKAGATVSVAVHPCREVGGDLVDIIDCGPLRWAVLLCDVAGRGEPAALTAAAVRTLARDRLIATGDVVETMRAINARLYDDFEATRQHVSVTIALVDDLDERVTVANAGAPPLLVVPHEGPARLVASMAPPLGIERSISFEPACLPLAGIDHIAITSDGVTEHFGRAGDTAYAVASLLGHTEPRPGAKLPRQAIEQLARSSELQDDLSLVWVRFDEPAQ